MVSTVTNMSGSSRQGQLVTSFSSTTRSCNGTPTNTGNSNTSDA